MRKQKYKGSVEPTLNGEKLYLETLTKTGEVYHNVSSQTGLHPSKWMPTFIGYDDARVPNADFEEIVYEDLGDGMPVSIVDFAKALDVSRTRANQILQSGKVVSVWRGDNELSQFIFGNIEKGKQEYFKARREGYRTRARAGGKAKAQKNNANKT